MNCYVDPKAYYDNKDDMEDDIADAKQKYEFYEENIEALIEKDKKKPAPIK